MNQHPIIENAISNLSHEFKTWGMPAKERIELRNKLITELEKENELDEGVEEKGPEDAMMAKLGNYPGLGNGSYDVFGKWRKH